MCKGPSRTAVAAKEAVSECWQRASFVGQALPLAIPWIGRRRACPTIRYPITASLCLVWPLPSDHRLLKSRVTSASGGTRIYPTVARGVRVTLKHVLIRGQGVLQVCDVETGHGHVAFHILRIQLRHLADRSVLVFAKELRGALGAVFGQAERDQRVHTQMNCAFESLAVNVLNAVAQQLVSMLPAGGARENPQLRKMFPDEIDDF